MADDNNRTTPDDDLVAAFSEVAAAIKSVRILAAAGVAVVSAVVGLPYLSPPSERTVERMVQQNPGLVRPDPWTGTMDRNAMARLRADIERERIRVWHEIETFKDNLNNGKSREHWKINALEQRIERLEKNSR